MAAQLACYSCGNRAAFPSRRCSCGEPLWFDTGDSDSKVAPEDGSGLWTAKARLPVARPPGFPGAVGGTPLYRVDALADGAGVVRIKDETVNPTGSFKDRGSAVGAAWVREQGLPRIGTVSHGNMARSVAATGAALGLEAVVLVPADIPRERLRSIGVYDPTIVRVEGDYGDLYKRSLELESALGGLFVNSDDPLRVAGQKTVAIEIMTRSEPDAIILPASSGGNASAVWKGLRELRQAGHLRTLPKLFLVQAAACSPIADAYRADRSTVDPVEPDETVAYSIANADPPSGNRALAAVKATDGGVVSVSEDGILTAQRRLSRRAGRHVEPASATTLAGLDLLSDRGEITGDDEVVLVLTGTGLPERPHDSIESTTVSIGALADRLPTILAD